jgi:hypothetical protein
VVRNFLNLSQVKSMLHSLVEVVVDVLVLGQVPAGTWPMDEVCW